MTPEIYYRENNIGDRDFIISSYLKSFRTSGENTRMTNDVYFYNFSKIIEKLLDRVKCLIACDIDDSSHIYGYILYEFVDDIPIVHYIYVKYTYRFMGIAKRLFENSMLDEETVVVSHINKIYDVLSKKYPKKFRYNPFVRQR
jgi:hypothetical protein